MHGPDRGGKHEHQAAAASCGKFLQVRYNIYSVQSMPVDARSIYEAHTYISASTPVNLITLPGCNSRLKPFVMNLHCNSLFMCSPYITVI